MRVHCFYEQGWHAVKHMQGDFKHRRGAWRGSGHAAEALPSGTTSTTLTPRHRGVTPWEARTPDLEVNSLTLWPTELRKQR